MNTFYTSERKAWRKWLTDNFEKEKEVWFIFPTKQSNEKTLDYNDAVEEALCFGWIDGQASKLDETHSLRRFTPRRVDSSYSRINIERLIWLDENNLLHPKIKETVLPIIKQPFIYSDDIISELKKDEEVWNNFNNFSESYKRIRIDHIELSRNSPKEFKERLNKFIVKTKQGKLIVGFGGTSKYYK